MNTHRRALCIDFRREENQRLEFIRTIRLLLTSMNISYLWTRVYTLLVEVCTEHKETLDRDRNAIISDKSNTGGVTYVKSVGAGSADVLELCAMFDLMLECFPIENYVDIAKEFLPRILIDLLNLMIDYCDKLGIGEHLALTRVVANIFEGISCLHRDESLLKSSELGRTSLNQVPSPIRSNPISLVAEDEEYIAEEAVEPSIDSSNNIIDDVAGDKSTSEQYNSHSNQVEVEEKLQAPSLNSLIDKFQALFHRLVVCRLFIHNNHDQVYENSAKVIEQKYIDEPEETYNLDPIEIDPEMTPVYESLCRTMLLISNIPIPQDIAIETGIDAAELVSRGLSWSSESQNRVLSNRSTLGGSESSAPTSSKPDTPSKVSANGEDVRKDHTSEKDSSGPIKNMSFATCRPYIQDLMLLSYRVKNIGINYASMRLLLDMLSTSKCALDINFALSNQMVATVVPSFSEELNASVVGDSSLLYDSRQIDGATTSNSPKRFLLLDEEFQFIMNESCWFSLAMKTLWLYLSSEPMVWIETVNLIQNMHNLTYQTLVCEDIICASLNSHQENIAYEARRRFTLLFSLMKGENSDLNLKQREFERPLFFMLDSLANKMDPFNCIARDWLIQVYKFRTTSRVLEPILKILLNPDTARIPIIFTKLNISSIHHTHMHLYSQVYDSQRILYALNTLWNVLSTDPNQGLIRMANASIRGCHELSILYARHSNALLGNSFHDDVSLDGRFLAPSFLELTIVTCLSFLSSYYMQLPQAKLTKADLQGNQKVRMLASEILRTIFSNLFTAIKGCPTQPIHDMLNRCKAQEIVLLHVATSVQCAQNQINPSGQASSSEQLMNSNEASTDNMDDFQRTLLRLLEELMILEYRVAPPNVISETENHSRSARTRDIPDISSNSLKYFYNILISSQRLFLSAVKAALQNVQRSDLHVNWLSMIETTLPISGRSLTRWIGCAISCLCDNLEMISSCILNGCEPTSINLTMTPKYLSVLMNSLTQLTHYCLLDHDGKNGYQSIGLAQGSESLSTLLPSSGSLNGAGSASLSAYSGTLDSAGSTNTLTSAVIGGGSSAGGGGGTSGPSSLGPVSYVVSNILHVFSSDQAQESGIESQSNSSLSQNDPIMVARKEVLNKLSQIIFALIQVWKAMSSEKNSWTILGNPAYVKKQILALLSPISLRHGAQFMNAISFVWHELRTKSSTLEKDDVIPTCSPDQSLLVEIVASISDLPMESVLQTTRQVISKTQDARNDGRVPFEVGLLQFFLAYIRLFPGSQLIECWKPLLHLIRDGLQLGRPAMPQAQFTLLALLHEFVQMAPLIEDRKDQKDLQDVAQKLIDSHTKVVGANSSSSSQSAATAAAGLNSSTSTLDDNSYMAIYKVHALNALAEFVAPILDVVYASEEKEKVVNLISGIMYYVNPHLKNHQQHNSPSFLACSHLLSSISGYQYTRKAWRKDALELLLDPQFFQMDSRCMEYWRVIVDHLMTHDKTTFRDFLARMTLNQSGGALKLFTGRDQESEQRAQLIKRMAFILFCSERDQYHKYTPEIQEKLIESLRDNPSDPVQAQIMLCFRVLITRSSAHLLTSLWPYVYTEMVQGLLDIESHLEQSIAAAVISTATNSASGSNEDHAADRQQIVASLQVSPSTSARFQLFLYTCKLLDMVLALPADSLPQFQMYRWSFIGAGDDFEPHLVRIERRLSELSACPTTLPYRNHYPVLTLSRISNLLDLHPFFKTLVKVNRCEYESLELPQDLEVSSTATASGQQTQSQGPLLVNFDDPVKFIDAILESDFLV